MKQSSYQMQLVDVARATPEEIEKLVGFHNAHYGTSRTPDQWLWQYRAFRPDAAVFAVARSGGRLVGTQAAMPIPLRVGDRVVLTGKSENTLLDAAYRGQGVMEALYEHMVEACRARGMELLWGFTDADRAFRRFGFQTHPVVETWSRPGRKVGAALLQRYRARRPPMQRFLAGGKVALDAMRSAPHLLAPGPRAAAGAVTAAEPDGDRLAGWEAGWARGAPVGAALHLGDGYLDWRVRNHPSLSYETLHHNADGDPDGYAIVALNGHARAVVAWNGSAPRGLSELLGHVVRQHQRACSRFVLVKNGAAPDAEQRSGVLRRWGFRRTYVTHLVVRPLAGAPEPALADPGAWRLNGLWTEGYEM